VKAWVFDTGSAAEAQQGRIDAAAGLPRIHGEGEYAIAAPGNAAARIRMRGVRTGHSIDVVAHADGARWAVPGDGPGSVDVDLDAWRGIGRDARTTR